MEYKVSHEKSPNYNQLHDIFKVEWDKGLIVAYGDTIHSKNPLREQKIVHEYVHLQQQKNIGLDKWCNRYMEDTEFRLAQELEAYRTEKAYIIRTHKDRNMQAKLLHDIYKALSSMYAFDISYDQAKRLL